MSNGIKSVCGGQCAHRRQNYRHRRHPNKISLIAGLHHTLKQSKILRTQHCRNQSAPLNERREEVGFFVMLFDCFCKSSNIRLEHNTSQRTQKSQRAAPTNTNASSATGVTITPPPTAQTPARKTSSTPSSGKDESDRESRFGFAYVVSVSCIKYENYKRHDIFAILDYNRKYAHNKRLHFNAQNR